MADPPLLKDFIDRPSVTRIVMAVAEVRPGLDVEEVVGCIFDDDWEDRALKQRVRHIAMTLRSVLPDDYAEALAVMRQAGELVQSGTMTVWCFNDFVEEYGVDDPDLSIPALEQFTKLASAEFAVRPFIKRYPDRMTDQMLVWANSDDANVRRLASEGFRPRLPWGMGIPALKTDPGPILPVLEVLYRDPSEVVRRSVANNLNDISKDHPAVAVETLARWDDGSDEVTALTKHALRTLLKAGDRSAMALLGFSDQPQVRVSGLQMTPEIAAVGTSVHVEFSVTSTAQAPQWLMLDYAVVFQNASGTGSRKVFKGKVVEVDPAEVVEIKRKISLQQMTTRRILPGPHVVQVQVNGAVLASVGFDVIE
ncbi:MAG: DNA alkylation repair protein [bacterium]|nr:DNA alkylation repair protein [bacterium]